MAKDGHGQRYFSPLLLRVTSTCQPHRVPNPAKRDACHCEAGYEPAEGGGCTACEPGKHKAFAGDLRCESCGQGRYMPLSGAVACRAARFGRWEEWDLDLSAKGRKASPLLCLGANWGRGCFLTLHDRDPLRVVVGPPASDLRAPRAAFEVLFLDATHAAPSYAEERLARVGAAAPDDRAPEGFLCPECRFRAASPEALRAHYARDHPA